MSELAWIICPWDHTSGDPHPRGFPDHALPPGYFESDAPVVVLLDLMRWLVAP